MNSSIGSSAHGSRIYLWSIPGELIFIASISESIFPRWNPHSAFLVSSQILLCVRCLTLPGMSAEITNLAKQLCLIRILLNRVSLLATSTLNAASLFNWPPHRRHEELDCSPVLSIVWWVSTVVSQVSFIPMAEVLLSQKLIEKMMLGRFRIIGIALLYTFLVRWTQCRRRSPEGQNCLHGYYENREMIFLCSWYKITYLDFFAPF
jgi:hypothetical protein